MAPNNIQLFTSLDRAFNERNWIAYSDGFAENFKGWNTHTGDHKDKKAHMAHAKEFCEMFADCAVHNDPYVVAVSNGDWTCTVARFTGTMNGSYKKVSGTDIVPTGKPFDILLANFARWQDGKIVEEYEFLDQAEIFRQAGINN